MSAPDLTVLLAAEQLFFRRIKGKRLTEEQETKIALAAYAEVLTAHLLAPDHKNEKEPT